MKVNCPMSRADPSHTLTPPIRELSVLVSALVLPYQVLELPGAGVIRAEVMLLPGWLQERPLSDARRSAA